jgi:hypothetical protein
MKTIIFYTRKGARKAKQQGLATAPGSAVTIRTLSQMALRGDGRLYIVDAPTAEHGYALTPIAKTMRNTCMRTERRNGSSSAMGHHMIFAMPSSVFPSKCSTFSAGDRRRQPGGSSATRVM